MNEPTWDRIKQVFHEVMARPPAERCAFLDEVCAGDTAVRLEVEGLLAAHDSIGEPETTSREAPLESPGATIGRYKLLQRIGEGGFGVVYMAEQERPVRRRVALKIIKPGMDTAQVVARFEAERQALAVMEHPNIAKVLDGGTTETGRPYFVMELVRGVPITRYCDANQLSTADRLGLFVEVCHAVQHAHQKGIVHRDLKPSNVMVTLHDGKPVPKVIDFGVAKAMQQRLTEKTLFTAYGQFLGTPAYMSPEQAEMSGLDVDTRSDVYSLGVLLYELLCGTTPFDPQELRCAAYAEIQRILKDVEPPRPSTRLATLGDALGEVARHRQSAPGALARLIRGDLDWIVMKALEKDRARRYASASELAADVGRFVRREPIVARPQSAFYRMRRLAARHRGPVAAAVAVVATIAVLGSVALWQGREARRQAAMLARRAIEVRASSILATAAAVEDPAERALLLLELGDDPRVPGRLRVARDVANEPIPTAVLRGHPDWVVDVAFSPDGRHVATASADEVRIWSADGRGEPALLRHDAPVGGIAFLPDGIRVLVAAREGAAHVRRVDGSGEPIVFAGSQAILAPGGAHVAAVVGAAVHVRPVDGTGTAVELRADSEVTAVAFGSDAARVVTGHRDGSARIWPADGTGQATVLRGHAGAVTGVAWVSGERPLVTHGQDGTLRRWMPDGSAEIFRRQDTVRGDRELPKWHLEGSDDAVIFSGGPARAVRRSFRGSTLAVSADGKLVADGYWEGAARLRGPGVHGESLVLRGSGGQVLAAAFGPDGGSVVTGHADGTARIWSLVGGEPRVFPCAARSACWGNAALAAELDPDGAWLATAWSDGSVRLLPVEGGAEEIVHHEHAGAVSSLAFSPDGARVASASHDGTARIRNVDGRGETLVLHHDGPVVDVAFSPDGSRIATASRAGGETRVFSADGKGEPLVLGGDPSPIPIHAVAFSPDGSRIVTGGPGAQAWVRSADGIGEPVRLEGFENVRSVAFSPDGTRVALGCGDGEVRIWNADGSGEPVVLHDHLDEVFGVAFDPAGTRLATASEDGTVRVSWLDGSRDPLVLRGHGFPVRSVAFDRDGSHVVSAGEDGTARLWRVSWNGLARHLAATVHVCLTPEQRTRWLAEPSEQARSAYMTCERRYGR